TTVSLIPFWLIATALVGLSVARTRELFRDLHASKCGTLTTIVCALALLPLALTAERNVPPFLLLAVPAIAVLITRGSEAEDAMLRPSPRTFLNGAITGVAGVLVLGTIAFAYTQRIDYMRWAPLSSDSLAALRACRGNLYNRYDEGGYL